MSEEKFLKDTKILLDFIELFCNDKHENKKTTKHLQLSYNDKTLQTITYTLCLECEKNFLYSYDKLKQCPHDPKPRCRHCKKPCYEKQQWKNIATIMKYSGIKTGLSKIKKIFTFKSSKTKKIK